MDECLMIQYSKVSKGLFLIIISFISCCQLVTSGIACWARISNRQESNNMTTETIEETFGRQEMVACRLIQLANRLSDYGILRGRHVGIEPNKTLLKTRHISTSQTVPTVYQLYF